MPMRALYQRRLAAFTLIELLVVIAIVVLLIGILLPGLGKARKSARGAACMGRMQQIAVGVANYSGDARGNIASFSWRENSELSSFADLNFATTDYLAHADQAVDIARRRGTKKDQPRITLPNPRLVDRDFTHLVLMDAGYFSEAMPEQAVVCPEDAATLQWQRTPPDQMLSLRSSGRAPLDSSDAYIKLLPYSSSYQAVPYTFCQDQTRDGRPTVAQNPAEHRLYLAGTRPLPIGGRKVSEVLFPSQKVAYFDLFDRHRSSRTLFYAYPQASQALAFFDGSVRTYKTADTNPGWEPNNPESGEPTRYKYFPGFWGTFDPPTLSGAAADDVVGYYRWTKYGLKGYDVGGSQN